MSRALARRVMRSATSRTWPTEPGGAREVGGVERLHRVDHAHLGPLGVERGQHRVEVGLGQHGHLERGAGQPLGAQADLRGRLLARDVQRAPPGALQVPERHRGQRRLADARRAADQHQRAGDEPAAQDAVELADRGLEADVAHGLHRRQPHRLDRAARRSPCARAPRPPASAPPPPSVFHSWQVGHCPIQRGVWAPQAEQAKTVLARAMGPVTLGAGGGRVRPPDRAARRAGPSGPSRCAPAAGRQGRAGRAAGPSGPSPCAARPAGPRRHERAGALGEHVHPQRVGEQDRLGQQPARPGLVARAAARQQHLGPGDAACAPATGACPCARASPARRRSGARPAPSARSRRRGCRAGARPSRCRSRRGRRPRCAPRRARAARTARPRARRRRSAPQTSASSVTPISQLASRGSGRSPRRPARSNTSRASSSRPSSASRNASPARHAGIAG